MNQEYKLYRVYYLGDRACWKLRVARSPEEALEECLSREERIAGLEKTDRCCRVEPVEIKGFRIIIEKIAEPQSSEK
jgi:hypothetical protein